MPAVANGSGDAAGSYRSVQQAVIEDQFQRPRLGQLGEDDAQGAQGGDRQRPFVLPEMVGEELAKARAIGPRHVERMQLESRFCEIPTPPRVFPGTPPSAGSARAETDGPRSRR